MLDLSYVPKQKNTLSSVKGSTALSMQNVVNNAMMNRQGQAVQGGATPPKTDGFGRSV